MPRITQLQRLSWDLKPADGLPVSKPFIGPPLRYKDLLCAGAELALVWADGPGKRWLRGWLHDVSWAEGSLGWEGSIPKMASWKRRPAS